MEIPKDQIGYITHKTYFNYVNDSVNEYVWYLGGMAGLTLMFSFISKFSFSILGENVTL